MKNVPQRKKLSPNERRALCQQWRTSGLNQAEFCKQQGVALSSFRQWLSDRPLIDVQPHLKNIPAWVPMEIKNNAKIPEESLVIEIILPNKIRLKFSVAYSKINSVIEQLSHANTVLR
jgi:hypothetical protein